VRRRGEPWEEIKQTIWLTWTSCHYGGQRPWWRCPGCDRRVAVLYGAGERFLCRRCYDLVYPSQRESLADRAMRRGQKVLERLGWHGSLLAFDPEKPKGMHWKTYRLYEKAQDLKLKGLRALVERFDRPRR
jgi:hypothetical protein